MSEPHRLGGEKSRKRLRGHTSGYVTVPPKSSLGVGLPVLLPLVKAGIGGQEDTRCGSVYHGVAQMAKEP